MPNFTLRVLCAMTVVSTVACGNSDVTRVTSPASETSRTVRLVAVDSRGAAGAPISATMGEVVANSASVRVVDALGAPVAGAPVNFTLSAGATFVNGCAAISSATDCTVVSDAAGLAVAGAIRTVVRDTVADLYQLSARLVPASGNAAVAESRDTSALRLELRASRDLSRFGGTTRASFAITPIDRRAIEAILPLGTFSTDDALPSADAIVMPSSALPIAVRAMSDGLITELDANSGSVTLRVRDDVRVRVSGIAVGSALWVGKVVLAGDTLGAYAPNSVVGGQARGVAVRVFDGAMQRTNWVRPERYGARSTTAFFVRYLADSVRSEAFALVRRAAPDLDGRIDYDRAGKLVGTWFDPSASVSGAAFSSGSSSALVAAAEEDRATAVAPLAASFVYDAEHPGQVRVALGSGMSAQLGLNGVRSVGWDDADPAMVGVAQGVVMYHLYPTDDELRMGTPERVLLVQLVDDTTLRLEVVAAGAVRPGFSARAVTLVR